MATLTTDELQLIRMALTDLRFIQAAALVASKCNEDKAALEYMRSLHRLTNRIDQLLKQP